MLHSEVLHAKKLRLQPQTLCIHIIKAMTSPTVTHIKNAVIMIQPITMRNYSEQCILPTYWISISMSYVVIGVLIQLYCVSNAFNNHRLFPKIALN